MRIALIGATGFVGSALLKEALDRGHEVTAIVRHPDKLVPRERFVAIGVDVNDTNRLAASIRGLDALISAFNPGWKNPNLYDDQVRGTASIIAAVKNAGVPRVLWVGGAGGLETGSGVRVVDNPAFPDWVRPGSLATIEALEQLRRESQLDWTFLSPAAEMRPGARTGRFRLGGDRLLVDANGQSHISVEDFAMAMIDELERPAHSRRRFTVAY
ncbi:MAG TPA: NAD(P)-dependent oxidoreductase [Burkholderiales bacterium]|nr:NAD(P)-dependent oxidoreductase [Burkholderiales bacterium]